MLKLDESFGNQEILLFPFSFVEIWVLRVKNFFQFLLVFCLLDPDPRIRIILRIRIRILEAKILRIRILNTERN